MHFLTCAVYLQSSCLARSWKKKTHMVYLKVPKILLTVRSWFDSVVCQSCGSSLITCHVTNNSNWFHEHDLSNRSVSSTADCFKVLWSPPFKIIFHPHFFCAMCQTILILIPVISSVVLFACCSPIKHSSETSFPRAQGMSSVCLRNKKLHAASIRIKKKLLAAETLITAITIQS